MKRMYKIKTLNEVSPLYRDFLRESEYTVSFACADPDAIIVRSADMRDAEIPDSLLAVGRAGVGVNNIPLDEMGKRGVVVFNTPGANANAVKELAIAALLLCSRDIIAGVNWCAALSGDGADITNIVESGKARFIGPEIKGKTLGVIGLGGVGGMVANAGRALDMKVLGFDPYLSVEHAWLLSRAIGHVRSRDELLAHSDYISLHIPLLPQTKVMFMSEALKKMKPSASVINFSRGELAIDGDIINALDSGALRRYVTDFPSAKLIGHPRVITIPHLGASTPESEENCFEMVSRQLDAYLKTGAIINSVNYPDCELDPTAHCRMTVLHANVPNMVSSITSLIAGKDINIDNMVNKSRGQFAYTVLELDHFVNGELTEAISHLETVYRVRMVSGL
jgi:D-3-phosphoglycerate dehydrogenase